MAQVVKKQNVKRSTVKYKSRDILKIDLKPLNYIIIGIGLLVIIIGYIMLSQNSVDGFIPTVLAPIVLVIGYCVIIPIGILFPTVKKENQEINPADKNVN
jgi:hypothetical protein